MSQNLSSAAVVIGALRVNMSWNFLVIKGQKIDHFSLSLQKQSESGLHCLSRLFWQANSVQNIRTFNVNILLPSYSWGFPEWWPICQPSLWDVCCYTEFTWRFF